MNPYLALLFHSMMQLDNEGRDDNRRREENTGNTTPPGVHVTARADAGLIAVDGRTPKVTWELGGTAVTVIIQDTVVGEYDFAVPIGDVVTEETNGVTMIRIKPREQTTN